jgi:hypothetical protein
VCEVHQAGQLQGQVVQAVVRHIQVLQGHHATNVTVRQTADTAHPHDQHVQHTAMPDAQPAGCTQVRAHSVRQADHSNVLA